MPEIVFGVDFAKEWIDLARSDGRVQRLKLVEDGYVSFAHEAAQVGVLVVFAASGDCDLTLRLALDAAGVRYARVNPAQARFFAKGPVLCQRLWAACQDRPGGCADAAEDGVDPKVGAHPAGAGKAAHLNALVTLRQQVVAVRKTERARRHQARDPLALGSVDAVLAVLDSEVARLRIWPMLSLSFLSQISFQPAWGDQVSDGVTQPEVFICQFGDTARAYAFTTDASEHLVGVGPLQGWSAVAQQGGLVARGAGEVLIIGEGTDSLVQNGQLIEGQCADAGGDLGVTSGSQVAEPSDNISAGLGTRDADAFATDIQPAISDAWLAGIFSLLDPQAQDTTNLAAIVDALSLDDSTKGALKASLLAAGGNPDRIKSVARQIQRALGVDFASSAHLRTKLRDAKRELEAVTQALDDQRQRVQAITAQLNGAEAQAHAAVRAKDQTAAQLASAQRGLREKDAELNMSAQTLAATNRRMNEALQQAATLKAALAAAATDQQNAAFQINALSEQLADMRARLGKANKRIDELKAGRN